MINTLAAPVEEQLMTSLSSVSVTFIFVFVFFLNTGMDRDKFREAFYESLLRHNREAAKHNPRA